MNDPKSGGGPMGQRKPLEWPPSTLIENPSENDVLFGEFGFIVCRPGHFLKMNKFRTGGTVHSMERECKIPTGS